ncbi:unnamed protein product [Caenorhabditis nigoni]
MAAYIFRGLSVKSFVSEDRKVPLIFLKIYLFAIRISQRQILELDGFRKKIEKSFEASKKNVVVQIQLYATVQVEKVQVGGPSGVVDSEEVDEWSSELVLENYRKPTDVDESEDMEDKKNSQRMPSSMSSLKFQARQNVVCSRRIDEMGGGAEEQKPGKSVPEDFYISFFFK